MRFISAIVSEPAFYFFYSLSRTHFPVLFIFYSRLIQTDTFFLPSFSFLLSDDISYINYTYRIISFLCFIYKFSFSRYDISII